MRIIIFSAVVVSVSACAGPQPICNRDAIEWDKWGTVSLPVECLPPSFSVYIEDETNEPSNPSDKPNDPVDDTDGPSGDDHPTNEPDVSEPTNENKKDDNSDANGKGGNKHDRKDKDKPSQEIAEGKKND